MPILVRVVWVSLNQVIVVEQSLRPKMKNAVLSFYFSHELELDLDLDASPKVASALDATRSPTTVL